MIRAKQWKIAQLRVLDSGFWKICFTCILIGVYIHGKWRQPEPDEDQTSMTILLTKLGFWKICCAKCLQNMPVMSVM